jgi:hypothetical protein
MTAYPGIFDDSATLEPFAHYLRVALGPVSVELVFG